MLPAQMAVHYPCIHLPPANEVTEPLDSFSTGVVIPCLGVLAVPAGSFKPACVHASQ